VQSFPREVVAGRERSPAPPCSPLRNRLGRIRGWAAEAAVTEESRWGEGGGGDAGEESR
jgi:hypothetical protein